MRLQQLSLLCAIIRVAALNSDAYHIAVSFLRSNSVVTDHIGTVKKLRLSYTDDSSFELGSREGKASFTLVVKGQKACGTIPFHMIKSDGTWKIVDAELVLDNGDTVSLR